jgi:hypothetical protein
MTPPDAPEVESAGPWQYLGLGCMMLVAGLFGGGMIGVLAGKIVGWARHCSADANTGAPCDWLLYWFVGAVSGALLLPVAVLLLRRRGRAAARKSD